jgi:SAM-dependent methyltransferase
VPSRSFPEPSNRQEKQLESQDTERSSASNKSHGPASDSGWQTEGATAYAARIATEQEVYKDCLDVHDLPPIFHYWSNRHLRPKLEEFGISTPEEMFRKHVEKQFHTGPRRRRIASLGAGNCQLEVDLAVSLVRQQHENFAIDCLELNPAMLKRGQEAAVKAGVAAYLNFASTDLNTWRPTDEYDAVLANQILHHVLNLEGLFTEIGRSLKTGGTFVISDMIGRNGHLRWPEALRLVREFWRKLPPSHRFNQQLRRYEEMYLDWDCSGDSFEGIRSQDILPLLLEQFHFEFFFAFANIVSPFVERSFGVNFDPSAPWDRDFIDAVNECDKQAIASSRIPPTHLLAVVGTDRGVPTVAYPLPPRNCLRRPGGTDIDSAGDTETATAYQWGSWPHSDRSELEIACRHLQEAQVRIDDETARVFERTRWGQDLTSQLESAAQTVQALQLELEERNQWALRLDSEADAAAKQIQELQETVTERTEWAARLDRERMELIAERNAQIARGKLLDQDLETCAAHITKLDREIQERTLAHRDDLDRLAWAAPFDRRFHHALDWAVRLANRIHNGIRKAMGRRSL